MSSPIPPRKRLDQIPEYYSSSESSTDDECIQYPMIKDPEKAFQLYLTMAERSLLTSGSISRIEIIQRYEITNQVADRIMDALKDRFLDTRKYEE